MKRNKVPILWLLVILVVMVVVWFVPTQFEPIQVQSEQDVGMEWKDINFMLSDESGNRSYVDMQYQNDEFNHLSTDYNTYNTYMGTVYEDVYGSFPITNRPNLREYAVVNTSNELQFWYHSPYLRNTEEEKSTFEYTLVNKETAEYTEATYTFPDEQYSNYYYISYAEDEDHFYILLGLDLVNLHQLTIDKATAEVLQDEDIEYEGAPYSLSTIYQNEQPTYHVFGIYGDERTSSADNYGSLSVFNNRSIAVIDPTTLELTEIEINDSEGENSMEYRDTNLALIYGENLYNLKSQYNYTDEGEFISREMNMYQYDWEENDFSELWSMDLAENVSYTIQGGQLYLTNIEKPKHAQIEQISLNTGELEQVEDFTIKDDSNYQFSSVQFKGIY